MESETTDPSASDHQDPTAPPEMRPGWQRPRPETLPQPTYWPVVLAFGVVFLLWGIVTTFIISGVGFVLTALAIYGWIGELFHEQ
jgi:hypothetical protein